MCSGFGPDYRVAQPTEAFPINAAANFSAPMFFDSWARSGEILIVAGLAYGGLIIILRVCGKRMRSKTNAFDLVVTVALGSTLATVITSKDVPQLVDG